MADGPRDGLDGGSGAGSFSNPGVGNPFGTDALYGGQAPAQQASFGATADSESFPSLDETGAEGSFTETTSVSWFGKIQEAIVGVLIGLVLVVVTAGILFWNEGRAVKTYRSLNEGAGLVVDVPPGAVDAANDGKLVHLQGDLTAATAAQDTTFGVQVPAARLVRTVEMFQWKEESRTETHKRLGGGEDRVTTYTYTRVWSDHRNSSDSFHTKAGHVNPQMRLSKSETTAPDARLGAFRLGGETLSRLAADRVHAVEPDVASRIASRSGIGPAQAVDGKLYLGQDAADPRIGDLRVSYHVAPLGPSSFIGRQTGTDLGEYQTRAGDRLLMARSGLLPADAMFADAQADNRTLTWIIRLVATIFMWVGFLLVLRPIAVVGDVVPLIGTILGAGTALAASAMTAVLAPLVIAIAWFFFRPIVAIAVVTGGFALVYGVRAWAEKRRAARAGRSGPMPAALRA